MRFTDIFIRRPVLATVVSLIILLVGVRSLGLLQISEFPESQKADVTIQTIYPGASAELVKGFITAPLEGAIATADGIDYMESTSAQGLSLITVNLDLNYPPFQALTQITSKVNRVRGDLPEGSESPIIDLDVGETTSAMYISFYSETLQPNQITDYLERVVKPELESLSGVQSARILGERVFAMRIWLKPERMAALDVTPSEVRAAIESNNFLAAVGQTKGSMVSVTLDATTSLSTVREFQDLVIKESDGAVIRLEDVASVVLGAESYEVSVRYSGQNATFIGINVLPTANPLTVIEGVREAFPSIKANFPEGLNAAIPYDSTKYIQDSIKEVIKTLVEALLIVVVVIFLFLGSIRTVMIPVVAMPLSLIGAGAIMLALGFSINLLTLLAMVLAIGLVVDDAIIVVENIHRHVEEGQTPLNAALMGARELGGPVIAMTITLIAVYAPIGFMGGLTGALFTEFAFTLAGAVLISGIVALTLSPMMCARLLKADTGKKGFSHWLDVQFERLRNGYERRLHGTLNYKPVTLVFGAAVLVSCPFLFITSQQELAPTEDQGIILVSATGAPNSTLDQTELFSEEITEILQSFPETQGIFLINGGGGGQADATNSVIAGMVLKPWSKRTRTAMQLQPLVQNKLNNIAGFKAVSFIPPPLPGGGSGLPVQFVIGTTNEPQALFQVSNAMLAAARQSGLFAYVETDMNFDKLQVDVNIDRDKAAALGLDMQAVGGNLAAMLSGAYVNRFSIQSRAYKVIPQVQRVDRLNPEQLKHYYVRSGSGDMIPLSSVVTLERTVVPRSLERFQQLNAATISGVPLPGVSMGEALSFLERTAERTFPDGFSYDYAGQSRQFVQTGSALIVTFFFAIIIIFLVLAAQFESFRDPLVILVSVPMSIAGALVFLSLGFASINIYTQVGLITLIGLISKHGILIVQFANQLQEQGYSKRQAIEDAAGIRLRPVLMTTAAMVFAMFPLILATGAGSVSRFNMGLVIATGMSIGTLFTLFVVPAMYLVVARDHHQDAKETDTETVPDPV